MSNPAGWTGGVLGGGEIRTVEVLKKWHSWGMQIETLETSPSPSLMMNAGYTVHRVSPLLHGTALIAIVINTIVIFFKYLWMLKYVKSRYNVIVASNSNFIDLFPAWLFSKLLKNAFALVFQVSNYRSSFSMNYKIRREERCGILGSLITTILSWQAIRLAKGASAIFCLSKPIMEILLELGFPQKSLHLTSMGLNHEEIEAVVANDQRYDGVFLGRVEWAKGVNDLLDAWKIITREKPNANLLIVGTGDFLEKAKQHVKKTRMDRNVKFVGFIAGKEKYSYLKSGKVFIYPSRIKEGWGLAIAEAMACGLPVVCSDNPVFLSVFGGCKSVILVPIGDVEGLASAILRLLNDEESLRSYGEASKAYAQEYNWESIARHELHILKNICKTHRQMNRR